MKKSTLSGFTIGMISGFLFAAIVSLFLLPTIVENIMFKEAGLFEPNIESQKTETDTEKMYKMQLIDMKGDTTNLASFKDQLVFLNFWATWCGPCIQEMTSIEKLQEEFASNPDVALVLVSQEEKKTVQRFVRKTGFQIPSYISNDTNTVFNQKVLPVTYIIYKGKIIYQHTGKADWSSSRVVNFIKDKVGQGT